MTGLNIISSALAVAMGIYFSLMNPHLLPLNTMEIVPIYMQAILAGFLLGAMLAFKTKELATVGMLASFALLAAGFLGNPEINLPFYLLRDTAISLNIRIACIVLGTIGAIRCWYDFRAPTKEIGKAETAFEFLDKFFK